MGSALGCASRPLGIPAAAPLRLGQGCAPRPRLPFVPLLPPRAAHRSRGALPPSGQSPTFAFFPFNFIFFSLALLTSVFLHKNPKIRPTPTRGFGLPGAQRVRAPGRATVWVRPPTSLRNTPGPGVWAYTGGGCQHPAGAWRVWPTSRSAALLSWCASGKEEEPRKHHLEASSC